MVQFHKIYAIGFPERTDKRDAFALATAVTGFDVEWSDGVKFEDISKKAAPVVSFQRTRRCEIAGLMSIRTGILSASLLVHLDAGERIWM